MDKRDARVGKLSVGNGGYSLSSFVIFDLLFLPRLPFLLSIPISLPLVLLSLARKRLDRNDFFVFLVLSLVLFSSVLVGSVDAVDTLIVDNLKRALQLISILLYYFYFTTCRLNIRIATFLLRGFFLFVFAATILFFVDQATYAQIIDNIYPEAASLLSSNIMFARFPYIFADPNSAGYLISLVLVAYISLEKDWSWLALGAFVASISILATQSRGAYISLFIIYCVFLYGVFISGRMGGAAVGVLFLFSMCVFIYLFVMVFGDHIQEVQDMFSHRLDGEEDVGGGRSGKYRYFLENINILPFGVGYSLLRDGLEFRPHSDLVRWNFSYGLLSLPLLVYFIFPRKRVQIMLFTVSMIPFLVNSLIDDYRLLAVYIFLHHIIFRADREQQEDVRVSRRTVSSQARE